MCTQVIAKMASTPARKLQQVTYEKRLEIVQKLEAGVTVDQLVAEYGLAKRTIQRYRQNAISIRQNLENSNCLRSKRIRPLLHDTVDTRLYTWYLEKRALGDILSDSLLKEKAMELHAEFGESSNFAASNGWLECFKNRHNIRLVGVYGETADANELTAEKFQEKLRQVLIEENIDEEDVYYMNETCLMWKALPQKALFQGEELCLSGRKIKKDRVTVAFCANATGTHKLPPLFIHKYATPKALKHCRHCLPVVYQTEQNGYINEVLFNDWYTNHFKPSVRQHQLHQGRAGKVLLLVDNCRGHTLAEKAREDPQFKQLYLPSNTAALIQPMDQGITAKCKQIFRHKLLRRVLQHTNGIKQFYGDYDIKDCIDLIAEAWKGITSTNIQTSWRKLLRRPPVDETYESEDTNTFIQEDLQEFQDTIQYNDVVNWISECEKEERVITEEDNMNSEHSEIEEETDFIFSTLATWTETQPDFIKQFANILIDYYNQ
ncbi:jerky protein homolog-like [Hylaeus volcanicus]|uniref:jerky protein homolog-like n=1 Tax=Hylaeus volcanicus TaxID=313075 RepID=UPI0023B82F18|nr:jerky protein homolog-like [Hylaeus volcanicus]